jgi:hypothetical protein
MAWGEQSLSQTSEQAECSPSGILLCRCVVVFVFLKYK